MVNVKVRVGGKLVQSRTNLVVRTAQIVGLRNPAIRTATTVRGSPRTHVSKRKRKRYNKPPARTKNFGPIKQHLTPRPYTECHNLRVRRKNTRDVGTNTVHTRKQPKASTLTKGDKDKGKAIHALNRLKKCVTFGHHWTSVMIALLLRCLFGLIVHYNYKWTKAVYRVAQLFNVKTNNVFKFANSYVNADDDVLNPEPLEMEQRGRGSAKFKAGGADRYSILKEHHLTEIIEYVSERNTSQRGMCNVKSIQAHLLKWCGTFFPENIVYYALRTRLGFKYRTPACKRIVFSPERTQSAFKFVGKLDGALKEERAGTAIVIYMDETYCHLQHVPGKMWFRDSDIGTVRSERARSKGSLQIILHAMYKGTS